uniref:DUF11 domain-containing protein n=1 Tax=Streptomyces sp. NBC_00003 TaxID=2903608 RepID=A0AAU2V4B3_9ACTN
MGAALIATGTPSGATGPEPGAGPAGAAGIDRGVGAVSEAADVVGPAAAGGAAAEADVSYHGHVSLWNGRVGIWLATDNHGPAPVSGTTVRLRFSVALDPGAALPPNCLRTGPAEVQCGAGSMRAAGAGGHLALDVATVGIPTEVGVDIDTTWNGGASDHNPANNTHRVLALATGDPYTY